LSFALSEGSAEREVIGIDHDRERVRLATAAALDSGKRAPSFESGDLREKLASFAPGSLAGVAMIDILHYFDAAGQLAIIAEAARVLAPEGRLVMREVDSDAGLRFALNRAYERLATGVGFTRSTAPTLLFRGRREWTRLLEEAGFTVRSERRGVPGFADVLFIGLKTP
jgi:SAM-dependent methyltransferase